MEDLEEWTSTLAVENVISHFVINFLADLATYLFSGCANNIGDQRFSGYDNYSTVYWSALADLTITCWHYIGDQTIESDDFYLSDVDDGVIGDDVDNNDDDNDDDVDDDDVGK